MLSQNCDPTRSINLVVGTEMGRKIFRSGNPNFQDKAPQRALHQTLSPFANHHSNQIRLKFGPKNACESLADVAVKLVSVLSPACSQRSFKTLGKIISCTFSSKGRIASTPKTPRLGWITPSPTSWQGYRGQGRSGGPLFGKLPFCLITTIGGGSFQQL